MSQRRTRKRTSAGGLTQRLSVPNQDPNFHYRWVNDEPGRPQMFQELGYEFADKSSHEYIGEKSEDENTDVGTRVSMYTRAQREDGAPLRAYLMRQPIEFRLEDEALQAAECDKIDEAMYRNEHTDELGKYGYVPDEVKQEIQEVARSTNRKRRTR